MISVIPVAQLVERELTLQLGVVGSSPIWERDRSIPSINNGETARCGGNQKAC